MLIIARPCRKWNVDGAGIVIFGVTAQFAFRNLKCSRCGWPAKSTLPVMFGASLLVTTPWNLIGGAADHLDALQAAEEIEMPPRAAEFAVGRKLQADLFLLLDDLDDLAVFDWPSTRRRRSRPWRVWRAPL